MLTANCLRLPSNNGSLLCSANTAPGCDGLRLITSDLQNGSIPDLATSEGQALIEATLDGAELLILDNLSALVRSGKENEGESWIPIQEWALRLRQRGVSVLFIHHAGKGGTQRGTSRREDLLDVVIALRHPSDYSPADGMRCVVEFEKVRHFCGENANPFEVRLEIKDGVALWTTRDVEDELLQRAAELFKDGISVTDVAEEMKLSRAKAGRLRVKAKAAGLL